MSSMHTKNFFEKAKKLIDELDLKMISSLAVKIAEVRKNNGRVFFIGVGGSAGNCSHAVNDFRKLCDIECYSPSDNVSELTARINDEGWETSYSEWLKVSKLNEKDCLFIFSVGGGNLEKKVSMNIVKAIELANKKNSKVFGVVGRDGGFAKKKGDFVVVVPTVDKNLVTPFTEGFQAVIWHCLVSDPVLQIKDTKW